jgi:pimeloyl-ACP methyl ester carboxylesterase
VRTYRAASLFVYEWGREEDPAVLYWDGLGGTGLHANEIGPLLVEQFGLRVMAPDAPGHGRSAARDPDAFRPSRLAAAAAELLTELGVERAAFVGFSWGGRVACWFAAQYPGRTSALALVEGGHHGSRAPTGLEAAIAEAQVEREEDTFNGWDAFFAFEAESLRRWTPALEEAHRDEGGRRPRRPDRHGRGRRRDQPGEPPRAARGRVSLDCRRRPPCAPARRRS